MLRNSIHRNLMQQCSRSNTSPGRLIKWCKILKRVFSHCTEVSKCVLKIASQYCSCRLHRICNANFYRGLELYWSNEHLWSVFASRLIATGTQQIYDAKKKELSGAYSCYSLYWLYREMKGKLQTAANRNAAIFSSLQVVLESSDIIREKKLTERNT